jgi:hypothetical protein
MKLMGFLLLTAGWAITLSAIVLLASSPLRGLFIFAALVVEVLGLTLVVRGHIGSSHVGSHIGSYRDQE